MIPKSFGRVPFGAATIALAVSCSAPELGSGEGARSTNEPVAVSPVAREVSVFFLGGQSNMEGYGRLDELPPELRVALPGAWIFHGNPAPDGDEDGGAGIWAPLQPGHGTGFRSNGGENYHSEFFGPELSFARRMLDLNPSSSIALIKYSGSGSALDSVAGQEFGSWSRSLDPGSRKNQYDHFRRTVQNALADRDIDGDGAPEDLRVAGIVWMQGEADATVREAADQYTTNLSAFVSCARAILGSADIPVVVGRISDSGNDPTGTVWQFGPVVRDAQRRFVENDHRAVLVTTTDGYSYSDPWHYDGAGYIDLGSRFAEAMHNLRVGGGNLTGSPRPSEVSNNPVLSAENTPAVC